MNYPALEDIFLRFGFDSEKTPGIKEINRVTNRYLDRLCQIKKTVKIGSRPHNRPKIRTRNRSKNFRVQTRLPLSNKAVFRTLKTHLPP